LQWAQDVLDLQGLLAKLTNPVGTDQLSRWLGKRLSQRVRDATTKGAASTERLTRRWLLADLNRVIRYKSMYRPERFKGIAVPSEILACAKEDRQGPALVGFNRSLLAAAYPAEIRSPMELDWDRLVELRVDFSDTTWFDIAALVFLLCILNNQRSKGTLISLELPDSIRHKKARDFLCRWKFDQALRHALDNELTNILQMGQLSYFDEPQTSYTERAVHDEYGDLTVLASLQLLEIKSLTELTGEGNYRVSFEKIGQVTDLACAKSLCLALSKSIGASQEWANKFGHVLIHQALLNAFEHPEATLAYISLARQRTHLVIAIVDNGLTISSTIADSYAADVRAHRSPHDHLSSYQLDANRISYATWRGTSRKPHGSSSGDRGMGLYYIKTLAAQVGGYLLVRASQASVLFRKESSNGPIASYPLPVARLERGNLLKIFLPIAPDRLAFLGKYGAHKQKVDGESVP
jgi:hypothetical protein